jgi:ATP phosphoribosyltransferase
MAEIFSKELPDNRVATVIELTFGRARITVARRGSWTYDDGW